MIKKVAPILLLIFILAGCSTKKEKANTDVEVANIFIKSFNAADFKEAASYMLDDKSNQDYFTTAQKSFVSKPVEELTAYKNADIIVHEVKPLNDSVTVIDYSNSNKKDQHTNLKLVKQSGQWLVDLKFTFQ